MNSEPTESKTPVQRFVMPRFSRRIARSAIRCLVRTVELATTAFHLIMSLLVVVYLFLTWNDPFTRIGVYLTILFCVIGLFGCKWFDELKEWSKKLTA